MMCQLTATFSGSTKQNKGATTMTITRKEEIIKMGGKEWSKNGLDRVYITCDILNKLRDQKSLAPVNFSSSSNKIFFDVTTNKIFRSYKNKKPKIELEL